MLVVFTLFDHLVRVEIFLSGSKGSGSKSSVLHCGAVTGGEKGKVEG